MSYSLVGTSTLALAKIFAYGASGEPAYPSDDSDWYVLLNAAYRNRVYPRILRKGGDQWFYKSTTFSLTSGQAEYSLAATSVVSGADFHRLKQMSILWSSNDTERVRPFNERERDDYAPATWSEHGSKRYVVRGSTLEVIPTPTSAEVVRLVYVPTAASIYATSSFSVPECVEQCVALESAIDALRTQKEDTTELRNDLARAYQDLDEAVENLHHDEPMHVADVRPEGFGETYNYYREPRA